MRDALCGVHVRGRIGADPEAHDENNVLACWNLLEAMRKHGVGKLIFSSSAAVYGEPREIPISESHPQEPRNPYGETKRVMEQMLRWYGPATGSAPSRCATSTPPAPTRGTRWERTEPEEHLIPLVLRTALGLRKSISVFGTDRRRTLSTWATASATRCST